MFSLIYFVAFKNISYSSHCSVKLVCHTRSHERRRLTMIKYLSRFHISRSILLLNNVLKVAIDIDCTSFLKSIFQCWFHFVMHQIKVLEDYFACRCSCKGNPNNMWTSYTGQFVNCHSAYVIICHELIQQGVINIDGLHRRNMFSQCFLHWIVRFPSRIQFH